MDLILFDTPLGPMGLGGEGDAITALYLPGAPTPPVPEHETPVLAEGRRQILAYCVGERRAFDLPLKPQGTPFQQRVWAALGEIPFGETRTYGQVAKELGCPKAVRAVGGANHRNPIAILIPCHRVVGQNGSLTGYAGGLALKQKLLELEGASLC